VAALLQIGLVNAALATLLACIVALVARKVRRPALTHLLWICVLAKLVSPPVFEVPIEVPFTLPAAFSTAADANGKPDSPQAKPKDGHPAMQPRPEEPALAACDSAGSSQGADGCTSAGSSIVTRTVWGRCASAVTTAATVWGQWLLRHAVAILVWTWLAGAAIWFLRQALSALRYSRRLALATPAPAALQQRADELAQAMGLAYHPPVLIVRDVISPMLWGIGRRTRLLFPVDLLARLAPDARETLIAHELAHFRRGDHWVRLFELVVSGLYWWNPIVWWARHEIEIAEEECCDAWVIDQFPKTPRCYAEALLETLDFLSGEGMVLPPAAAGLGRVPFLRRRLTAIMRGAAPKSMSGPARLALYIAAAVLLPWHPGFTTAVARPTVVPSASTDFAPSTVGPLRPVPADVSVGIDGGAALVDVATASTEPSSRIDEPAVPDGLWAIAKSPGDRYWIMRYGRKNSVLLHDTVTGKQIDLSEYHIMTVAFSSDAKTFVTGGSDQTVRVCVSSTGEVLHTFRGHADAVQSVAFTHGGKAVVSVSRDGWMKIWSLDFGGELAAKPIQVRPVNCLCVSPDDRWVAVGAGSWLKSEGGQIAVYDMATLELHDVFPSPQPVGAVAFRADNNTLVSGDWNGQVTFWDVDEHRQIGKTLPIYKDAVAAAHFSPDSRAFSQIELEEAVLQPAGEPAFPVLNQTFYDQSARLDLSTVLPATESD
jgi:beta-lactamase regulating signal transducer with metallopeptidase domain